MQPVGHDTQSIITEVIRSRRSIKPFDMDASRAVDKSLILELLENANHAPTHGLTEPWRFHLFTGDSRRTLAETMARLYRETTPEAEFREDKMRKMSENPLLAGAVIVLGMARRGGAKIPELEEIEAVACAVQNLALSVTASGLAGYWSSPPLVYTRQFADWLGLGPEDRCLGLFYLGWPKAGFTMPKASRKPVAEKITWH
ncbi:nitroreductase [Roseimicrobium sp. ORNL1]|uniref:nitroreductase family protein n=1 Tax=Roseimicrobium sp. ORNL1 TaxID=2711231 RepID=UPI0013E1BB2E|nr:nitroreductase [Roseimicrobium sp. ORNL1]QIF03185.1 nitroreductase [Roseimicrobium sp. ORNL1]